jgi:FMN phosphatase YigB (HAD superfamily)
VVSHLPSNNRTSAWSVVYSCEHAGALKFDKVVVRRALGRKILWQLQPLEARMGDRVEALLFDLGRVVFELDTEGVHARWAELAGIPVTDIEERYRLGVIGSAAFDCHERGEISDEQFFEHLRYALNVDLTDEQVKDGWNMIFVGEVPGIRRILSCAQKELSLYVFSNTNSAHHACWSARFADLLAPFRKLYLSHEIGARKPDVAAFRAFAADTGPGA